MTEATRQRVAIDSEELLGEEMLDQADATGRGRGLDGSGRRGAIGVLECEKIDLQHSGGRVVASSNAATNTTRESVGQDSAERAGRGQAMGAE